MRKGEWFKQAKHYCFELKRVVEGLMFEKRVGLSWVTMAESQMRNAASYGLQDDVRIGAPGNTRCLSASRVEI